MKNSILTFDSEVIGTTEYSNYKSFNKNAVIQFINSCDSSFFGVLNLLDNDKFEGVSYRLYGTDIYWDLLLILNEKNVFDTSFDFDSLNDMVDEKIAQFESSVYGQELDYKTKAALRKKYLTDAVLNNEKTRRIVAVKPSMVSLFISNGILAGVFNYG